MEPEPLSLALAGSVATPCIAPDERLTASSATHAPEERTLGRAQAGETGAFRELVRAHQSAVYSLALRLLGVREDAQELAQDVFMLLYRHLTDISSTSHLRFWLRRTVCHRAIDRLRRRSRLVSVPLDAVPELEAPTQNSDPVIDRRLRRLIARLPAMPRAVLLLRYQEDLDPPEIARALELPLNTVKSHLRRSLTLLRSRYRELHRADAEEGRT
jgi:RNA polymerase sigma-70 factor, ECF subfamily